MMMILLTVMLECVHSLVFGGEKKNRKKFFALFCFKKGERAKVPGQGLTAGCASEDALQAEAGVSRQ